jgi:hypothetical protein
MPDEFVRLHAYGRQIDLNSTGNICKDAVFRLHGGYKEIGKKHGPEEDVFYQGRGQAQGTLDLV